jgi:hypothetical protein
MGLFQCDRGPESSARKIKEDATGGSRDEEMRSRRRIVAGRPEGEGKLDIPGRRWRDNIKIDVKGTN